MVERKLPRRAPPDSSLALQAENAELKIRLAEMQETLHAIQSGDVDALVVNNDIFVLESASAASSRLRQDVLSQMQDAVFAFDNEGHLIYLNAAAELHYGLVSADALGRHKAELFSEVDVVEVAGGEPGPTVDPARPSIEATHVLRNGASMSVESRIAPLLDAAGQRFGVLEVVRDVTQRVRSAAALRDSEARLREVNEGLEAAVEARTRELMTAQHELRQAQKMEAVGQLTGGIAHDFNNLLGGMSASLQLVHTRLRQGKLEGVERYLAMSQEAIKRAAALTQRLLAFARRQTLDPKPTDVNRLITGLEELIRRTVGPNVVLEVVGAGGLWVTKIDASQLENSLINLCINARDAMQPHGGRLTIETANKWLDDRVAAERDLTPGQYVSLCVTDTGSGMPAEVIERIFDPFFTTKPLGQGTGLGLSMVYGFVRQSGGQVRVYSEIGKGTTMCLYLPRHWGSAAEEEATGDATGEVAGDGERVLVIDDETTIRVLIAEVLEEAGYQVVTAEDGPSGLRILQAAGRIDILVTDVGLPNGLNGRQVADAARLLRPGLKVLFITGYAENAMVGNGLLAPGMQVLTKPFDLMALTKKVREMTDSVSHPAH